MWRISDPGSRGTHSQPSRSPSPVSPPENYIVKCIHLKFSYLEYWRRANLFVLHVLETNCIALLAVKVGVHLGDIVGPAPKLEGAVMLCWPRLSLGFGTVRRNLL